MKDHFELVCAIAKGSKLPYRFYRIKASKMSLGMQRNDKTYLWATIILPWDVNREPAVRLNEDFPLNRCDSMSRTAS